MRKGAEESHIVKCAGESVQDKPEPDPCRNAKSLGWNEKSLVCQFDLEYAKL